MVVWLCAWVWGGFGVEFLTELPLPISLTHNGDDAPQTLSKVAEGLKNSVTIYQSARSNIPEDVSLVTPL